MGETLTEISSDRLGEVERVFEENFRSAGELGASVSLWHGGREILALHKGFRDPGRTVEWDAETLVPIWSATKALASATCLLALEEAGLDAGSAVRSLWPEFAVAGKEALTFGDLLSHRAGVSSLDRDVSILEYDAVIRAIEAQRPGWPAGEAHGYHARTFGFMADELVRRLTGASSLGEFWRARIAGPLGLELWIGLPETEFGRMATLCPARGTLESSGEAREFYEALGDPESLTRRTFQSPRGLHAVREMNESSAWALGLPAMGGIGTASALGKFYAVLAGGGTWEGKRYFTEGALCWMEGVLSNGDDRVLKMPTAFSAGFMKDPVDAAGVKRRCNLGPSVRAFGHPGAGGSHAFADPENGIAFAYVMNQMELGVMPNAKSLRMVEGVYGSG